jgi:DNA-binding LacI/PurR family transcriptional regulator
MQSISQELEPHLERALKEHRSTAWIGANDITALVCLDFLHKKSISVPRQISVTGFDDSSDAFMQQLTSYNFNGASAVEAMFRAILGPWRQAAGRKGGATAIDGFIAQRSTTGNAPAEII